MRVSSLGGWSVALLLSIVTLAAANSADSGVRLIEANQERRHSSSARAVGGLRCE